MPQNVNQTSKKKVMQGLLQLHMVTQSHGILQTIRNICTLWLHESEIFDLLHIFVNTSTLLWMQMKIYELGELSIKGMLN